jgi:hypothetical protein
MAHDDQGATALLILRQRFQEHYQSDAGPVSAILEATFRIDLPDDLKDQTKQHIRNALRPKLVIALTERLQQPVAMPNINVAQNPAAPFVNVNILYHPAYQGSKHFYTTAPHPDNLKAQAMKLTVNELNQRWASTPGVVEGVAVPPGTYVSVNFLISRPLDYFRLD